MPKPSTVSYTLKAELHCHANRRYRLGFFPLVYDSAISELQIIHACQKSGIRIVAITDHNSLAGYHNALALIKKMKLNILPIPACEITTSGGHILAYGINSEIPQKQTPAATIDQIHNQDGLAFAAHPFNDFPFIGRHIRLSDQIYNLPLDGLEVYNSAIPIRNNRLAASAASKLNLPGTASSDAHTASEIGRAVTVFPSDTDSVPKFLHYLKTGNFIIKPRSAFIPAVLLHQLFDNFKSQILNR